MTTAGDDTQSRVYHAYHSMYRPVQPADGASILACTYEPSPVVILADASQWQVTATPSDETFAALINACTNRGFFQEPNGRRAWVVAWVASLKDRPQNRMLDLWDRPFGGTSQPERFLPDRHGFFLESFLGVGDYQAPSENPADLVREIKDGERLFVLSHPIPVTEEWSEGLWQYENAELGLLGYSTSKDEAFEVFQLDFASSWDNIAQESDDALAPDAQRLKKALLDLVLRVERLP